MRRFWKTVTGKMTLFLLCGLCGIVLAGTILGAVMMVEGDFYTREESDIREGVFQAMLSEKGQDLTWQIKNGSLENESGKDGNLTWQILGSDGKVKAGNDDIKKKWQYTFYYASYEDEDDTLWTYPVSEEQKKTDRIGQYDTVNFDIDGEFPLTDQYALASALIQTAYGLRYLVYMMMALAFVLGLLSFVTLMSVAGRENDNSEIHPGPLYGIPSDLLLIFGVAGCSVMGIMINIMADRTVASLMCISIGVILTGNLFLGFCMSIAVRIKKKTLWKNTVIYRCFHFLKKILKGIWQLLLSIPVIWKVVLGAGILSVLEFMGIVAFSYDTGNLLTLWFLEKLLLFPAVFYGALMIKKLQKGADALAKGELSYQINTTKMHGDFKKQGEDLNSIASGMSLAVEKQLKSERMKTELITNVSHDIKTPLTSIINYADLIGKEPCENKKITEYAEVLVRQSGRLKRLIEDLVEASKASTGNLEVHLEPCDASVFLTQAGGEYEEKLEKAGLTLIVQQPEQELRICADGRRMWRVFDNLMNNICKYAQPGTRVYLTLEEQGKKAVITFKNTSREALNISEEELMERFVRGDRSRNTEGNGLGLSIARSLTELQKGKLYIRIDGDLFKAILEFPVL